MFKKLAPLQAQKHANLKIKKLSHFNFAKSFNLASIMVHEFIRCASIFPIVFYENPKTKEFRPSVLLGLTQGENLFVQDGKWLASYIPAIIRRHPFALVQIDEKESKFTICIDEDSEFVNEIEGTPLFEANGNPSPLFHEVKKYLGELQNMDTFTHEFCEFFKSKDLFAPLKLTIGKDGGQTKDLKGFFMINEEKLNALPDDDFLTIRKSKFLAPIYAHFTSLAQVERLTQLKQSFPQKS